MMGKNFLLGVVIGLALSVFVLYISLHIASTLTDDEKLIPVYTIFSYLLFLVVPELLLLIYYTAFAVEEGSEKQQKLVDLSTELDSIQRAKEDVQKGYFQRNIDEGTMDNMLQDLKQREIEVKNKIDMLRGRRKEEPESEEESEEAESES